MNCEQFRLAAGADPRGLGAEARAHRDACARCAEYLRQVLAMDATILKALQVPVSPALQRDVVVPLAAKSQGTVARALLADRRRWYALAASVVGGVLVGVLLWATNPRESLARDVLGHVAGEPGSLVEPAPVVDPARVREVLDRNGIRLRAAMGTVSYARSCDFHGHEIPHLVVQTATGPVTVLVLRHEHVSRPVKLHDQGFVGTIEPSGPGSIAVIGASGVQVAEVFAAVQAAVEWLPR